MGGARPARAQLQDRQHRLRAPATNPRMRVGLLPLFALSLVAGCTEDLTFPKGFLFGSAIAGFQVEMGCPTVRA